MYEQVEVPVFRRIIWIIVLAVVAVVVLCVLIWLIFFRHPAKKPHSSTSSTKTSQKQQAADNNGLNVSIDGDHTATSGTTSTSDTPGPTGASKKNTSNTGAPSTELANTGAGNVIAVFAVASVTGSVLYYVRLRRKAIA